MLEIVGLGGILALGAFVLLVVGTLGLVLWARRLVAQHALQDLEVDLIRVPLATPGHAIALHRLALPRPQRFRTPVIVCHGMAVNRFSMDAHQDGQGSDRLSLARTLRRAGFDVFLLELRGRGNALVPPGADWSVDDEVREDVPAAIDRVCQETGARDLLWVGHSKGSILQLMLHSRELPAAAKVRGVVAIGSPSTVRFQREKLGFLVPVGELLLKIFGRLPFRRSAPLLTPLAPVLHRVGGRWETLLEMNPPASLRHIFASIFEDVSGGVLRQMLTWVRHPDGALLGTDGFVYEQHFDRIRVPLLLIAGARDLLAPPEAVGWVRDRAKNAEITWILAAKANGFSADYGHGDLVLGERAPEEIFPPIVAWLSAHAEPAEVELPSSAQPGEMAPISSST
ncbi:MAG: alpha/beta fold hydrolase [Myxococcota bacterium]